MTLKQLWYRFIDNDWPAKVICFVIAVLTYVLFSFSSVQKKQLAVRLDVVENGSMCLVSDTPPLVQVTVRAPREKISSITESSLKVKLNISTYTENGEYDVPVIVEQGAELLMLDAVQVTVQPEHVKVTLEKSALAWVPVEPMFSGTPGHGYEQKSYAVSPDSVQISGPESMVRTISSIPTGRVDINGATSAVSRRVQLFNRNEYVHVDHTGSVAVDAEVAPVIMTKVFTGNKVELRSFSSDFTVSGTVPQIDVGLRGAQLAIEGIQEGQTLVTADCSSITETGTYELPVRVSVPSSIAVVSRSQEKVTVTVTESYAYRQRMLEEQRRLEAEQQASAGAAE